MTFRKLGLWTVGIVYFLILVGGIVRATGSGMGCPDWPKCFGMWVPPTEASQLPANYQEIFGAKLKGEVEFNVVKTWIEYLNRLLGVLTGLFIFGTLIASISYLKKDKVIFWLSFLTFLLVGFQGWLGSKVVSTELHPVMVTAHMLLAIVIVFILLYAVARSYNGVVNVEKINQKSSLSNWLIVIILLTTIQVVLGTQVREAVDTVSKLLGDAYRSKWIENLGTSFLIHRSYSLIILGLHLYLIYQLRKQSESKGIINQFTNWLIVLVIIEILTGIIMAYFAIPAFAQPIHLTLATIGLGLQFVIVLYLNKERVFLQTNNIQNERATI
jgi:heme a synthase